MEHKFRELEGQQHDPEVAHRLRLTEESLHQETVANEKMRAEILMLKWGVDKGLKQIGIHFSQKHKLKNTDGYMTII